jgi:hypothetical protein
VKEVRAWLSVKTEVLFYKTEDIRFVEVTTGSRLGKTKRVSSAK